LAEGLTVVGSITAEGLVEVNGKVDGPLNCSSVVVGRSGQVSGNIAGQRVVIDGAVEGEIFAEDVLIKSCAHVVGDIAYRSLTVDKGAFVDGRLVRTHVANAAALATVGTLAERATESAERQIEAGRSSATFVDGKEIFFAALIGLALISLMSWLIVG
jgi:cytoskeletal protein CcmA (bactofilin family)